MVAVNPDNIRWARKAMNLGIEDAAKKLGFTSSEKSSATDKLRRLENGETPPTQVQLSKMANVYRQPVAVFYLNTVPRNSEKGQDFRTLPQQTKDPTGNARLEILISMVRARQSLIRDILESDERQPLPFVASMDVADGIEHITEDIINTLGFNLTKFRSRPSQPAEALKYIRRCAEDVGIFVLLLSDLGHPQTNTIPVSIFRGFALADDIAPFVVINRKDSKRAQAFTLLHEVAHIWLGSSGISGKAYDSDSRIERLCSRVAGRILLPIRELQELSSLRTAPFKNTLGRIQEFADARNISRAMVAYNLRLECYISQQTWLSIQSELDREHQRNEEKELQKREQDRVLGKSTPIDSNRIKRFSLGEPLLDLARRSLANGDLTPTKASTLLGVSPRKVRSFLHPQRAGRIL